MKTLTRRPRPFASRADIPKTYRELCQLYLPRPIHDETEDAEATFMMNALAVFTRLNAEQRDYFDVLTEFVDEFDKGKKIQWPEISGLDVLKHLMEERGMSAADLLTPFEHQPQPGRDDFARRTQTHPQPCPDARAPLWRVGRRVPVLMLPALGVRPLTSGRRRWLRPAWPPPAWPPPLPRRS